MRNCNVMLTPLARWVYIGSCCFISVSSAEAASFDCGKTSMSVEKIICSDTQLSKLDDDLDVAYTAALRDKDKSSEIRQAQKEWLKLRNLCTQSGCIENAYKFRIAQLSSSVTSGNMPFNISFDDDVEVIKAKLDTNVDLETMQRTPGLPPNVPDMNEGKTFLHARSKGIWVFFNKEGKIYTVRVDAPFEGNIRGIKLGDNEATLIGTLGKPISKNSQTVINSTSYRYALDDSAYVTYNVNNGSIQFIFITR